MNETKIYTVTFDEKKNLFRLVPETGRAMRVKPDHKKFEWLKKQEAGKVVKINASGRWTASKDYDGLYARLQEQANTPAAPTETAPKPTPAPKRKPKVKAEPAPPAEPARQESVFGHHYVWLGIEVIASRYQKVHESKLFATGSDRVDLSVDPKSDAWPIVEEVPCPTCKGEGKLVSFKQVAGGFLNLMKKQVRVEEVCPDCGGLSHTETLHYPYHFEGPAERAYNVDVTLNIDPVVAEILEEFVTQDEFSKRELLHALTRSKTVRSTTKAAFQRCWDFEEGTPLGMGDVPPLATWAMVQEVQSKLNTYSSLQVDGRLEEFIKPFFKAGIIDHGTKRRSTKDTATYYKFTKGAKAFYKTL